MLWRGLGWEQAVELAPLVLGPVGSETGRLEPSLVCHAMRCDAMRCDAMQCDAMQCDAIVMRWLSCWMGCDLAGWDVLVLVCWTGPCMLERDGCRVQFDAMTTWCDAVRCACAMDAMDAMRRADVVMGWGARATAQARQGGVLRHAAAQGGRRPDGASEPQTALEGLR
eukprot:181599-Rhodomonas_salina.1